MIKGFPERIGHWVAGPIREYPPPFGCSIPYRLNDGTTASIHFYNGGHREIEPGPASSLIQEQFEQAKRDLWATREQRWRDLNHLGDDTVPLRSGDSAPSALRASFVGITTEGQAQSTFILLTAAANQFVKVRLTAFGDGSDRAWQSSVADLLCWLGDTLRKQAPSAKGTLTKAFGYQGNNMTLPVADVVAAVPFYQALGFRVVSRINSPVRSAVLERDDIRIGLAQNGGDPSQDGCAFHVTNLDALLEEFRGQGLERPASDVKVERQGDAEWRVFYVVAPDGLCFWFGERQGS